jgi:hypothetical protein
VTPVLRRITVTFTAEGIEYSVCYAHTDEPPPPGTKTRTTRALRMARTGLQTALEWVPGWGCGVGLPPTPGRRPTEFLWRKPASGELAGDLSKAPFQPPRSAGFIRYSETLWASAAGRRKTE